jgi:hypothetical protein
MRYTFLLLSALLMSSISFGQQEIFNGPAIKVDKDAHDYGTIKKGANGDCVFTITNIGSEPLILTDCQGTCGCTVPKCDKAPVMPGKTTTIKVTYDTQRIGPFSKGVTVTSNAVNDPTKMLMIKGSVEDTGGSTTSKPELQPSKK